MDGARCYIMPLGEKEPGEFADFEQIWHWAGMLLACWLPNPDSNLKTMSSENDFQLRTMTSTTNEPKFFLQTRRPELAPVYIVVLFLYLPDWNRLFSVPPVVSVIHTTCSTLRGVLALSLSYYFGPTAHFRSFKFLLLMVNKTTVLSSLGKAKHNAPVQQHLYFRNIRPSQRQKIVTSKSVRGRDHDRVKVRPGKCRRREKNQATKTIMLWVAGCCWRRFAPTLFSTDVSDICRWKHHSFPLHNTMGRDTHGIEAGAEDPDGRRQRLNDEWNNKSKTTSEYSKGFLNKS